MAWGRHESWQALSRVRFEERGMFEVIEALFKAGSQRRPEIPD